MVQDPDGKIPELEEDPDLVEEDDEDEEDEDSGEDQAGLALNTPEPARAKMASMPVDKKGAKGNAGKGKLKKSKEDAKAAVNVKLTDDALGLSDSEEKKPEESEQEKSAFDRDEITNPDISEEDIAEDNIDPLAMLAGARERPWENEKLSTLERMTMRAGYNRNTDFEKDKAKQDDPKAKGKKAQGPGTVKTAATAAVAVAVVTGAAMVAEKKLQGPSMSGINQGPRRQADQDLVETGSDLVKPNKTEQIRIEARENATDVTMRPFEKGLASSFAMQQKPAEYTASIKAKAQEGPDLDELMDIAGGVDQDWNNDTAAQLEASTIDWSLAQDDDAEFRARMDQIMQDIGYDNLSPVTPYREEMWSVKLTEYNENSADVTTAPELPAPPAPVPDLTYKQEPSFNFGPGGMG